MEAAAPDGSAPSEGSVQCAREPDQQSRHPSGERNTVERFDDQVDVIGLDRELQDAKPRARGPGDASPQRQKQPLLAQAGQAPGASKCDVNGMSMAMGGTHAMATRVDA